jgi:hypothetical protein
MNNLPEACTDLDSGLRDLALKIAVDEINKLKKENARLREALESISKNTCCEPCQEAKIVANKALEGE